MHVNYLDSRSIGGVMRSCPFHGEPRRMRLCTSIDVDTRWRRLHDSRVVGVRVQLDSGSRVFRSGVTPSAGG